MPRYEALNCPKSKHYVVWLHTCYQRTASVAGEKEKSAMDNLMNVFAKSMQFAVGIFDISY